jgi:hypothetical protein
MIKPASMLLDLGGGKAVVAGMKPSGWEALYDLGISNGVLSVAKHYASRSNLVRIERDGVLSFEDGSLWLGGSIWEMTAGRRYPYPTRADLRMSLRRQG